MRYLDERYLRRVIGDTKAYYSYKKILEDRFGRLNKSEKVIILARYCMMWSLNKVCRVFKISKKRVIKITIKINPFPAVFCPSLTAKCFFNASFNYRLFQLL